MAQWHTTKFRGVRYRKHDSRKHGVLLDKYFTIRFQMNGKRVEEGLGWASQGWSEQKAALELEKLKSNYRKGDGPIRLYEKRGLIKPERSEGNTRLYTRENIEKLEMILRMTNDLGVNLAGVEVVLNMRERIKSLEKENEDLKKKLDS